MGQIGLISPSVVSALHAKVQLLYMDVAPCLTAEGFLFQHKQENTDAQSSFGPPLPQLYLGHGTLFGAGFEFWLTLYLSSATLVSCHTDGC